MNQVIKGWGEFLFVLLKNYPLDYAKAKIF